ncbi:nitrilase family protein [Portibacter marinus]|uniref:nitrilase family protein n=1 Tax=Portibacter marinus TaxID=2898660 RepID=UPI001F1A23EA|nr:nitrilase family protein [Portibacter marinus]
MKIAYIQYDIAWESPGENRQRIEGMLEDQNQSFDLLVLPEMFTTGFSMNTEKNSETMDGPTLLWMSRLASKYESVVTGSIIIEEESSYYNRLIWMRQDGSYECYDKRHLFTLAKEHHHFSAGRRKLVVEMNVRGIDWRVCPLICYDLRFPVWSRNTEDYDLLIYVANWPQKREFAWSQLLIARAIENQCYTVGVNRVGTDGVSIPYSGQSVVLRYDGQCIVESGSYQGVFYANVLKEKMVGFRRAYGFLRDRDNFSVK